MDEKEQVGLDTHTVEGVYGDEANTFEKEPETRYVLKDENGEWVRSQMKDLHTGDKFRIFEPDGTPAHDGKTYEATNEPKEIAGVWNIDVIDI
jgi:hypothetical protein